MAIFVDIHAIQSVGPNNLNRDLSGSPKTATFGGVRRARVSSQSWKRAMREDFRERYSPENMGIRTLRVVKLLSDEITRQDPSLEGEAIPIALAVFQAAGIKINAPKAKKGETVPVEEMVSGYLVFLSSAQVEAAAARAIDIYNEGGVDAVKKARKDLKKDLKADLSVDLALFGRMVAEDADLNVDASCQVAHALSTHGCHGIRFLHGCRRREGEFRRFRRRSRNDGDNRVQLSDPLQVRNGERHCAHGAAGNRRGCRTGD